MNRTSGGVGSGVIQAWRTRRLRADADMLEAAAAAAAAAAQKCGPESAWVRVWLRLVNISSVGGAPADRNSRRMQRITTDWHTRTFYPLVQRPGGQRSSSPSCGVDPQLGGNATGRAHQANHCQTDRQTDGDSCRTGAWTDGFEQRQRQLFFFTG